MDGVQFNILYINGKCITIKKNETHILRPIVVDIFVAVLVVVLPRDEPPTPPSHGMAFTTKIKFAKDVLGCLRHDNCQCILLASRSSLSSLQTGGWASPSTLHPTRTTTPCAMNSRTTISPTKAAAVRED